MKYSITVLVCVFAYTILPASEATWSGGVAKILYSNCTSCHRDGGIAPFSLMTYDQAAQKSAAIAMEAEEKGMPPFPADIEFREYAHQKVLSTQDIKLLREWADAGAPAGDLNKAPAPPVYTSKAYIQSPDHIASMPLYTSTAQEGEPDVYRCFVLSGQLSTEEFISGIEVLPGNPEIVHHVLVFQDTSSIPVQLDARDAEPGYAGFGGVGSNTATLLAVYAPGTQPYYFPKGFGLRLQKNARIIVQMHYPAGTKGKQDQTTVRLLFDKSPGVRPVLINSLLDHDQITDGPFIIPANQVKTFHQEYTAPVNASLFAVMPHMHLLGKSSKIIAITPTKDTIPIVNIPEWDFHWQMAYTFKTLQKIPRGTVLKSQVTYDNTTDNHHNPNNPPKVVTLGEGTADEMMLTYFYYTLYRAGDENISLENTGGTTGIQEQLPEAEASIIMEYQNGDVQAIIKNPLPAYMIISDMLGRQVALYSVEAGQTKLSVHLPAGAYIARLQGAAHSKPVIFTISQ
jgi:hypothetical protein